MHVFYTPDIQTHAELPEEEAAHAVRVLRLQAGDEVMLTDGKGCFYRAEISTATNKRCLVNILETLPQAPLWKGFQDIHQTALVCSRTDFGTIKAAFSVCQHDLVSSLQAQDAYGVCGFLFGQLCVGLYVGGIEYVHITNCS